MLRYVVFFGVLLAGCATSDDVRQQRYQAYLDALAHQAQLQTTAPALLNYTGVDSGGKTFTLIVNMPQQLPRVEQMGPDDRWQGTVQLAGTILPVVGTLGGTFLDRYYGYKTNHDMWAAIGNNMGGVDIQADGSVSLINSANTLDLQAADYSGLTFSGFDYAPTTETTTETQY